MLLNFHKAAYNNAIIVLCIPIARLAATLANNMAERNYPTSKVRGRSWKNPMPERTHPRGVIPCPRSGATAKCARLQRCRNGQKELPHVKGQGQWPGGETTHPRSSGCMGTGGPRGAILRSRSGAASVRRYPLSKVRSSGCALMEQSRRETSHSRQEKNK